MKKAAIGIIAAVCALSLQSVASAGEASHENKGAALFKQHCVVCHTDGGNIVNPKKTLHKKDREANNIKSANDIIHLMRNPGPGMLKFDEKIISNKDAHEIAEYIIKTFPK
jgi:cytochrome c6